jgi:hypothetical protein
MLLVLLILLFMSFLVLLILLLRNNPWWRSLHKCDRYIQVETFLKVKSFDVFAYPCWNRATLSLDQGVDWRCGPWAPGIQSNLTHILPHVWISGWIEDRLWLAMPIQVSACTSHPAQGYLISCSHLRCMCSPPFLQRDLAVPPAWFCRTVSRSKVGGALVQGCPCWDVTLIHSPFVIQLLFFRSPATWFILLCWRFCCYLAILYIAYFRLYICVLWNNQSGFEIYLPIWSNL